MLCVHCAQLLPDTGQSLCRGSEFARVALLDTPHTMEPLVHPNAPLPPGLQPDSVTGSAQLSTDNVSAMLCDTRLPPRRAPPLGPLPCALGTAPDVAQRLTLRLRPLRGLDGLALLVLLPQPAPPSPARELPPPRGLARSAASKAASRPTWNHGKSKSTAFIRGEASAEILSPFGPPSALASSSRPSASSLSSPGLASRAPREVTRTASRNLGSSS